MINVFYFDQLNSIGGIETFFYQLGKKYGKDFDITVLYRTGDDAQIKRLSQYIRVRKYRSGQAIRCKRMFVCFNPEILDYVEADEYYQVLHGDYTAMRIYPKDHSKIQERISVSNVVHDSYYDAKKIESIVSYNPFTPEKPRKVINLVSATRLTREKGWERMLALADAFDKEDVPFQWVVYTDNPNKQSGNPSIALMPPHLNVLDYIANADYYVQLSDCEGYCYSVVEALSVGTPVIVTDFKVVREIGVEDGKNGFILPMDMSSVPIDRIYKGLKKFKYTPLEDRWGELLFPGIPNYEEEANQVVTVMCKHVYWDLEFSKEMQYGDTWDVPRHRAEKLFDLGLVELVGE